MLTNFAWHSRKGALMSTVIVFALTLSLLIFPAAASNKSVVSRRALTTAVNDNETFSAQTPQEPSAANQARAQETYGKLGLTFEANQGQTDARVNFITRAGGATAFLTPTAAVFLLPDSNCEPSSASPAPAGAYDPQSSISNPVCHRAWGLWMNIEGASPAAQAKGIDKQEGIVNYFIGNDPGHWHTNIPTFAQVQYTSVYPGVDLVYYGNQQQLEYDFAVQPGADAGRIALNFEGASSLALDINGDLLIETGVGTVRQHKPDVYQQVDGERQEIESGYTLKGGGRVGFRLGAYDRTKSLIIDPVLAYSTYLGANGFDEARGIAVDSGGNGYIVGQTDSALFPTTPGAFQTSGGTGFVTKLNAAGSARIYSTYLGGGAEAVDAIAVDLTGNAYLTGFTQSSGFPTTPGAFDTTLTGASDSFVTKLNATGSSLIYSTYVGGGSTEGGKGIAVDSAGNAYVIGETSSSNFPTANAIDGSLGGIQDDYVTKLNAAGTALVYSTYLGGDLFDSAGGIAVDSVGNAYVTGLTNSTNFPIANPIQGMSGGNGDAFVTKLNAAGNALAYSTYFGGGGTDWGRGIAVDSAGNAYVTGLTQSTDFPKKNAIQTTLFGPQDAFVIKLNAAGSASAYSTLLGGDGTDNGNGVAVDSAGNAYVVGNTNSTNFATVNPIQSTRSVDIDVFVTKLDASAVIAFSTYLGGNNSDDGKGIALDPAGNSYIAGRTNSTDFPRANAIQASKGFNSDAFVSKIGSYVVTGRVVDSGGAGIASVTVTLSGASTATTTTDANGNFLFLNTVPNGNYTVTPFKTGFTFSPATFDTFTLTTNQDLLFIGASTSPGPPSATTQFNQTSYSASEGTGFVNVTLTRTGDATGEASVKYQTSDAAGVQNCTTFNGKASERCDYTTSVGTVTFAAGESSKTFTIPLIDDVWVEGDETFTVTLTNAVDLTLGTPVSANIVITDNDSSAPTSNPIDGVNFFVRQQYLDILNRLPDTIGFQNWVNTLTPCPNGGFGEPPTSNCDRLYVAAGFFQSDEFLKRGYFAFRFYMVSFNQRPTYRQFIPDMAQVGGPKSPAEEESAKVEFANAFVQRPEFLAKYPGLSGQPLADALLQTAGLPAGSYLAGAQTNGQILRGIAESSAAFNKFLTEGTVSILYFAYQRRDPDSTGYANNVATLNANPSNLRHMIFIFIYSTEYRQRFGPP